MGVKFVKILLVVNLLMLININVYSQSTRFVLQDSTDINRVSEGDTIPEKDFSAAIFLQVKYDSTMVKYDFSECKLNSSRITLMNWHMRTVIDTLNDEAISNLNKTVNIKLQTNDTISFYRNFRWYNRFDNTMTTTNYYSRDTLTYKVELLDSIDNSRLEILDSFKVLRQVPSGVPSFLGVSNPFKKTFYIIPNALNGKIGYLKLSIFSNGDGAFYQARRTSLGIGLSSLLTLPSKESYRAMFGVGLNKSNFEVNTNK